MRNYNQVSKSLNELFGMLAEAGAPASAEQYRNTLRSIRQKAKIANGGIGSGIHGHTKTWVVKQSDAGPVISLSHHTDHPPMTNVQGGWMYHPDSETYSSEASQLHPAGNHDPWGRPLIMRYMKQHDDDEGDVTHWSGTIQAPPKSMGTLGRAAKLKIFND